MYFFTGLKGSVQGLEVVTGLGYLSVAIKLDKGQVKKV